MTPEEQGKEFEKIFCDNNVNCTLQEYSSNTLIEKFEFNLNPLTLNSYKQIKKVIELMQTCLQKNNTN